uniref:Transcription factor protein n=1 Tax=Ciona intestinalis TaxID=7719 RepID=Q4H3T4_CIOIN|nr:transcription factor protein [Ciona intestinalis]BAE06343.1 transcription factor protein [Ciona intestinalis]|eukprot:NP_001071667.1 transcription factor protein [Ciona intestinalis]
MIRDKKMKKKFGKTETNSDGLNLDDVIALGGDEEDFKLLQDVDNGENTVIKTTDTFKDDEFSNLISELGFEKYQEPVVTEADKKKSSKNVKDKKVSASTKSEDLRPLPVDLNKMPTRLLVKTTTLWHELFQDEPAANISSEQPYLNVLKQYAGKLFDNEVLLFKKKASLDGNVKKSGNAQWMNTVAKAGTLSDRVAALSLMVQEAPIHNFHSLELLSNMAKKKGRREAIMGLEAIRDLMLGDLLPVGRKLRPFSQQAINVMTLSLQAKDGSGEWSLESCRRRLIIWIFEHKLKLIFASIVEHLTTMSHDAMEVSKTKAMSVALELLQSKPEQEKALLSLIVNKLGDPKFKIASKSLHMLNCVVAQHPMMQEIIVTEVRDLLLRPNLAARAQYYCICFLSAQMLSHERKEVALKLVQIYMSFFKASLKKKSTSNKMLSALLTGINRAFPFTDSSEKGITEELNILFKTVHVASLSTTVQALILLYQVYNSRNEVPDRFHNAFYASILHTELPTCTHRHPMFLNLLYRSMKADVCEPRVHAYVKRLLQSTTLQLPSYCAAVLTMVDELCKVRPALKYSFLGSKLEGGSSLKDEMDDDGQEHFMDVKEDSDEETGVVENEVNTKLTSWTHKHKDSMRHSANIYDPLHRNPLYAGADQTHMWEIHTLARHFHPTVALYAKELLGNETSEPRTSNPLDDYTLMKFLDRFVYRNPKSKEVTQNKKKGANEPRLLTENHRRKHAAFNQSQMPVNTPEFLQKKNLSPDEIFFHKYFTQQNKLKGARQDKEDDTSDVESVSDDEFDNFMANEGGKLNFSDSISKKSFSKRMNEKDDISDDDSVDEVDNRSDDEDYGFNMEDDEQDLLEKDLEDAGMFVSSKDDNQPKKAKKKKGNSIVSTQSTKRRRHDDVTDQFNLLLEENVTNRGDSGTSSAFVNKDRSSNKQLKWEQKRTSSGKPQKFKNNKKRPFKRRQY